MNKDQYNQLEEHFYNFIKKNKETIKGYVEIIYQANSRQDIKRKILLDIYYAMENNKRKESNQDFTELFHNLSLKNIESALRKISKENNFIQKIVNNIK